MKIFLVFTFLLGSLILAAEAYECWYCIDGYCDDPEEVECSEDENICVAYFENISDEEKRSFSKGCTNQTALDKKCQEIAQNDGKCFPCYNEELCNHLSEERYLKTLPLKRDIDWSKNCVVTECEI